MCILNRECWNNCLIKQSIAQPANGWRVQGSAKTAKLTGKTAAAQLLQPSHIKLALPSPCFSQKERNRIPHFFATQIWGYFTIRESQRWHLLSCESSSLCLCAPSPTPHSGLRLVLSNAENTQEVILVFSFEPLETCGQESWVPLRGWDLTRL